MEVSNIIDQVFIERNLQSEEFKKATIEILKRVKADDKANHETNRAVEIQNHLDFMDWMADMYIGRAKIPIKTRKYIVEMYFKGKQ